MSTVSRHVGLTTERKRMEFIPEEMGTEHVFKNNNGIEFHSFFFFFFYLFCADDRQPSVPSASPLPTCHISGDSADRPISNN